MSQAITGRDIIDPKLGMELAKVLARDPNARGAVELMEVLAKVSPTAGARAYSLAEQARAMSQTGMTKVPLSQRVQEGMRFLISGIRPTTWFSPQQPLQPYAQSDDLGAKGRRWDFQQGQNIQFLPKSEAGAGVPFQVLRALRENYDLLSLVIETRKDQVCAYEWEIVPKDQTKKKDDFKDQIKKASEFFEQPTPDQDWLEWSRVLMDEHLVCDGVALYPRADRKGDLHSLVPIDVATVKLLIDERGMRPMPPDPAYQQIIKGVPAADYMGIAKGDDLRAEGDQLLYWMRNQRTNKLYGYSPVEQVITTVNIAMRRQAYQLEYYTEGNIPDALLGVPETWTPEQTAEFQDQFDSRLSGNTKMRRRLQFIPELKSIFNLKDNEVALTDGTDEWFARVICFCFSISPQALLKQMNRASAQQASESAKEEGLMPLLRWMEGKLTWVTNNVLMCPDVKFAFKLAVEVDPKVKADTNVAYVKAGIMSPDEARSDAGLSPRGMDELLVETAAGPVPLKETVERARQDAVNPPEPPPVMGMQPGGGGQAAAPGAKPGDPAKDGQAKPGQKPGVARLKPVAKLEGGGDLYVEVGSPIVDMSGMRINPPAVKMGGFTVKADLRREANADQHPRPMKKIVKARRDQKTGELIGEVTEVETGLQKSVTIEMDKDD